MNTNQVHAVKVTSDYDDCQRCHRTGLVRVVVLSDGSHVGTECMKKVLGWSFTAKNVAWQASFSAVSTHSENDETFILWKHVTGSQTRETTNGSLTSVGGVRNEWEKRGWL